MASALLSGAFRISNQGNIFNKAFDITTTISTWHVQQVVLANGTSEFVLSFTHLSAPNTVFVTANSLCRINYAGHASYVSAASAGWQFKDLWAHVGSGMSGPIGIHLANSSGDSAIITVAVGM